MSDPKTCPRCGAVLDAGDELCPRCLLELGRAPAASSGGTGSSSAAPKRRKRAVPSISEIAAQFPELEIRELVGEGGMGAVYKARQVKIDRLVALKVLALDPGDDPTFAERFRREAMVLARLDHPNVVKLYDFGDRGGLYYLVLEFVDSTNLRALMKQGLLAPKQALSVVREMCDALQFAHDEGIVHRDIKPENVLIDAKGRVKIADFGLAKMVDADPRDVSLTEIGQVMGTPHYMAPEQLRGAPDVDHRADIYSLGVVFYEMLTGELPRGKFDMPSKHVQVDVRLDEIVLKSLERAPERRYQHAIDVKTDVDNVGDAEKRARPEPMVVGLAVKRRRSAHRERGAQAFGSGRRVIVYPNRPWQYFVTFALMWGLAGCAFNGGWGWFLGAMLLVATSFWSLMEREVLVESELEEQLRSEPRDVIVARHVTALILLACAFGTLYLGHVALFDEFSSNYRSGPNVPGVMQLAHGLETRLLPWLGAHVTVYFPVSWKELEFTPRLFDPLNREELFHQPWLLFLAVALFLSTCLVFSSRWKDLFSWRGWMIPLRTTGLLLGSLLFVHLACGAIRFAQQDGSPLVNPRLKETGQLARSIPREDPDEMSNRLRIALVERGYVTTATGVWSFREPKEGGLSGEIRISFADPASAFDRWHLTWSGPMRAEPHAVFVLVCFNDREHCWFACDIGEMKHDSATEKQWSEWFRSQSL
jgi:tRNA A-37 threonylcarbamoyl transferase component Bud32